MINHRGRTPMLVGKDGPLLVADSHRCSAEATHYCQAIVVQSLSCVRLFATLWTVARQAPLSMGFSRQGYGTEEPFPSPGESFRPRD